MVKVNATNSISNLHAIRVGCCAQVDPPDYQLVELPARDVLFQEHRGPYDDIKGIELT